MLFTHGGFRFVSNHKGDKNMKSLYQELKEAGVKTENHESDLYFESTQTSRAILAKPQFTLQRNIQERFTHQGNLEQWIDIPFNFDPYWESKK